MYQEYKNKFQELEKQLIDPKNISNHSAMVKIAQEHAALKKIIELIDKVETTINKIADNDKLIEDNHEELRELAELDNKELKKDLELLEANLEEEINPANPNDKKNAIIEIRAGAGGDEAAIFAADLSQMYLRFCENQGWKTAIISSNIIGVGGYKEIIFEVKGVGAYGQLRFEAGTHRVQRVPATEKQGRVHTSTATVVVLPEAEEVDVEIKNSDIRIDTFCSSGPGGQSVNTTYSAVRVLHLPTGLIVSCQDQKSQHQNKEKALQILRSRLLAKQEEERISQESSTRKNQIGGGDRSDKIRTYNFPQDRVTDHRLGKSWHNIDIIMTGEISEIVNDLKQASK